MFDRWLGRERVAEGTIDADHARKLAATLDVAGDDLREGAPLPPGWHWIYLTGSAARSELGEDGHARRGDFLPPVPRERRMWAGGTLRFLSPLRIGAAARLRSTIHAVEDKDGRSGPLSFVTVRHELSSSDGVAIEEEQELVYLDRGPRRAHSAGEEYGRPDPSRGRLVETFVPDEVTLFRFSALTFNGHRIHYDRDYARDVEGYPDLVVHGPLIALLLLGAGLRASGADREGLDRPRPARFRYRAARPAFCGETLELHVTDDEATDTVHLVASVRGRGVVMRATLALE